LLGPIFSILKKKTGSHWFPCGTFCATS